VSLRRTGRATLVAPSSTGAAHPGEVSPKPLAWLVDQVYRARCPNLNHVEHTLCLSDDAGRTPPRPFEILQEEDRSPEPKPLRNRPGGASPSRG